MILSVCASARSWQLLENGHLSQDYTNGPDIYCA